MNRQRKTRYWSVWMLVFGEVLTEVLVGAMFLPSRVLAQITPDETLSGERSQVTRDVTVRGDRADRIDGGARRGANLFHSFREFNVNDGQRVYFANPSGVENILGRVTGNDISNIMGTLGVDGGANLFLINPNGIIFGPNAYLDVSGSFLATTGDRFTFADGSEFSATNPQAPPLLTMSTPIGVQYGANASGAIINQGFLEVGQGENLDLLGGEVQVDNGFLYAPGGRIELAGVGGTGTVRLIQNNSLLNLALSNELEQANVSISNGSILDVIAANGGSIAITGQNLSFKESSVIAGTDSEARILDNQAGDITLNALDSVKIDSAVIENIVALDSFGNAGNISINSNSLSVLNGAQLFTSTYGQGDAGNISINANDISFDGGNETTFTGAFSRVEGEAVGQGGDIQIRTGSLSVTRGARLDTLSLSNGIVSGRGDAGNISINARDIVSFDGVDKSGYSSVAVTDTQSGRIGNAGDISINARELHLTNGSLLLASSNGRGDAGDITIRVHDIFSLTGVAPRRSPDGPWYSSSVLSIIGSGAEGRGGQITAEVTNGSLEVRDGAYFSATTYEAGSAGNITIIARDNISFNGRNIGENNFRSGAYSRADFRSTNSEADQELGKSNGGNITITANSLNIINGAQVSAISRGLGRNAGNITVNARNISLNNQASLIANNDGALDRGDFGNIRLQGVNNQNPLLTLQVTDSVISASTETGIAGSLSIKAKDSVQIAGSFLGIGQLISSNGYIDDDYVPSGSGLFARANNGGRAGNETIVTNILNINDGAQISVRSTRVGRAGDINVLARDAQLNNRGEITATTEAGSGGNIQLQISDNLRLRNDSQISASTDSGIGGDILIQGLNNLMVNSNSGISSASRTTGRAGDLNITARSFVSLSNNGSLSAEANGERGRAGNLTVNARNISVGSGAQMTVRNQSAQRIEGETLGNITLNGSGTLQVDDGLISASTRTGQAGSIKVNGQDEVNLRGTGELSVQATGNGGNAGELFLRTRQLTVEDGARITGSVTTGRAGGVTVNATDAVRLRGNRSELAVEARGRRGTAGDLIVNTNQLRVEDGAAASVSSNQGQAGNLAVRANSVFLDNGDLTAVAGSGSGANINLQDSDLLVMRHGSQVSADARNAASGGNVNINPNGNDNGYGFLVAIPGEDSDIVARAVEGRGGEIVINSEGVFGIEQRSPSADNGTNDIDASSQRGPQGVVTINRPDTDPSRGLTELPTDVVDAANQINQVCPTGTTATRDHGSFVVTGRGGLPPNPIDALNGDGLQTGWAVLDSAKSTTSTSVTSETIPEATSQTQLVEAQSWIKGANGEVIFLPRSSQSAPQSRSSTSNRCQ